MQLSLRRLLIGDPLRTEHAHHQRLPKILALPIFASDALSSVAFATEETMAALLLAGAVPTFGFTPWISLGIVVLLILVTISYQQTITAYPGGGGSYTVAGDNLGATAGATAGAALLLDYMLNAAVCACAGAAAITSLLGNFGWDVHRYVVPIAVSFIVFIALINLRGVRESGIFFAFPVYSFVAVMYVLVLAGLYKMLVLHDLTPIHSLGEMQAARVAGESGHGGALHAAELEPFGLFLLLHAFASGCTALTGVEAISNGVTAFQEPAPRNARITMVWMSLILGTLFTGLSFLAAHAGVLPPNAVGHEETVLSQIGRAVFGTGPLYMASQITTCLILILSANTSFADFPRLGSFMARDGFLPKQLGNIGDKLVYDRGILLLGLFSIALIIGFRGSVHALIPLFAIGVFLAFTLSQAGMVKRWLRLGHATGDAPTTPGWQGKALLNGLGAAATCVVTIVFAVVKFADGAWVIVLLIPALICLFYRIHAHYRSATQQLSIQEYRPRQGLRHHVLVLVPDIHCGVMGALQYARTISTDAIALHVATDPERAEKLRREWPLYSRGVPLAIIPSPYRALTAPLLGHIDRLQQQEPNSLVTVVIPEALASDWWTSLLHGQAAFTLLWRLRFKPGVIATHVPYHIAAFVAPRPARRKGAPTVR